MDNYTDTLVWVTDGTPYVSTSPINITSPNTSCALEVSSWITFDNEPILTRDESNLFTQATIWLHNNNSKEE
mgnify:CR=1 FL=1